MSYILKCQKTLVFRTKYMKMVVHKYENMLDTNV